MANDNLRINGWKYQTKIDPIEHIKYFHKKGLKNIKVTDISKDGSLEGPPFKLYKKILKKFLCTQRDAVHSGNEREFCTQR